MVDVAETRPVAYDSKQPDSRQQSTRTGMVGRARERRPSLDLEHFDRHEFIHHRFDYKPGQHVTILAPTQGGKTTFGFQLLHANISEDRPGVVLVVKPRDKTVEQWREQLDLRKIRDWPPRRFPKVRGWAVWPRHRYDVKRDNAEHEDIFRRAIMDSYKRGNRVIFADEVLGLEKLGLRDEIETVHTRGAGMGAGQWVTSQRPYAIAQTSYSQAEHLFLGPTPDKRDRDRFREIGGVDPDIVEDAVRQLRKFQFLHIQRTGPTLCVVEPK